MKNLIVIIALLFSFGAHAQITKVTLQASGLTCSMCSNAINKSLQSIAFVDKVEANIKNSSFDIFFKPGAKVDLDKLKNKVQDAGFFVAKLEANINFDNVAIANDSHVVVDGTTYHFIDTKDQTLNGNKTIRILDKGFVTTKEFKKNSKYTMMECYKTGVAGGCCAKEGLAAGTRIFHVSI
ncbi:MAG: heavy-metal-associated domain-containing protein [Ferruginibacter sp.]